MFDWNKTFDPLEFVPAQASKVGILIDVCIWAFAFGRNTEDVLPSEKILYSTTVYNTYSPVQTQLPTTLHK